MTRNMRNRRGTAKSPETRMDTGTAELRNTRNRKTHLSIEKNNFEKRKIPIKKNVQICSAVPRKHSNPHET